MVWHLSGLATYQELTLGMRESLVCFVKNSGHILF
jgi:hypothetical protein